MMKIIKPFAAFDGGEALCSYVPQALENIRNYETYCGPDAGSTKYSAIYEKEFKKCELKGHLNGSWYQNGDWAQMLRDAN